MSPNPTLPRVPAPGWHNPIAVLLLLSIASPLFKSAAPVRDVVRG